MQNSRQELLRIRHVDGRTFQLQVEFHFTDTEALINAYTLQGAVGREESCLLASWPATYEPPNHYDKGYVQFGNGRIELEDASLRGIGIGSLLMIPLVRWARGHAGVPVANIDLAGQDARTPDQRDMRNGFYEKLGFTFDYQDEKSWGASRDMDSSKLIEPEFRLSKGWSVESIKGKGSLF